MNEEELKAIAAQLRKPHGKGAIPIANKMNEGNFHIYQVVLKNINPKPGAEILEIGPGNGFFVKDVLALADNLRYTGCDLSSDMVEECKKINAEYVQQGKADFFCTSADFLPLADYSKDLVFTVNTLYFWDDREKVLNELYRVLKPGGMLWVAIRPKRAMLQYPFTKYGFKMYSKEELCHFLSSHNFLVKEIYENTEPEQQMGELIIKPESLVVGAVKI